MDVRRRGASRRGPRRHASRAARDHELEVAAPALERRPTDRARSSRRASRASRRGRGAARACPSARARRSSRATARGHRVAGGDHRGDEVVALRPVRGSRSISSSTRMTVFVGSCAAPGRAPGWRRTSRSGASSTSARVASTTLPPKLWPAIAATPPSSRRARGRPRRTRRSCAAARRARSGRAGADRRAPRPTRAAARRACARCRASCCPRRRCRASARASAPARRCAIRS